MSPARAAYSMAACFVGSVLFKDLSPGSLCILEFVFPTYQELWSARGHWPYFGLYRICHHWVIALDNFSCKHLQISWETLPFPNRV